MLKKAVIVAGGFGTRLAASYPGLPKVLVPVAGKPILQRQIEVLKENGIEEIFLTLGHRADLVIEYIGRNQFGVRIKTIVESEPLGTGGALFYLREKIGENFFLCMGDILFDMDLKRLSRFHDSKKASATLVVHPNAHPYDSDLVVVDDQEQITGFISKTGSRPALYHNLVNAGAYVFSPRVLDNMNNLSKKDLDKDIIFPMIAGSQPVYGYRTTEYLKDIGTPERIKQAEAEIANGTVKAKNLNNKQKAIFLDRDGTVNRYRGLIDNHNDLELEDRAAEGIRRINRSEYLAIVVTNQPVIARNLCDFAELKKIHQKMEVLLGKQGAYLDDLFFCPHHPDSGYPEERKEYKIRCGCRKPAAGLIEQAVEKYGLDRSYSWLIGDSTVDLQTALNAGIRGVLVGTGMAGKDRKYSVKPAFSAANLVEAVDSIFESRET